MLNVGLYLRSRTATQEREMTDMNAREQLEAAALDWIGHMVRNGG